MKRSRAALTLFLAMFAAALQTVGLANIHRATAGDRHVAKTCSQTWSPWHDCFAGAPSLAANELAREDGYDDYGYEDGYGYEDAYDYETEELGDHCHAQRPCGREAYIDSQVFTGFDPCTQSYLAYQHEEPAYPIEEYVYGDASADDGDCGYACDEFDCCLETCRVHREDLTSLTSDVRHSRGCTQVLSINAENDGIAADANLPSDLPPSEKLVAGTRSTAITSGYDYDDNYQRGWDFDCSLEEYRGHDARDEEHDLCSDVPGCLRAGRHSHGTAVAVDDNVPFDLPPAEAAPAANTVANDDHDFEDEYNYSEEYSYDAGDYDNAENNADYEATSGYGNEPSTDATVGYAPAGADQARFGADYWNDEAAWESDDLPPGETLEDDMPPGETLVDDMPPGEALSSVTASPAESNVASSAANDYGWYDDLGAYEAYGEDLPPAESSEDDLPPAESLAESPADDLPVGEQLDSAATVDGFYEAEFYGNDAECEGLNPRACQPNSDCHERQPVDELPAAEEYNYSDDYSDDYGYRYEDEYDSYTDYRASDDLGSAGLSDDEASWGVGRPEVDARQADADALRPLLRSTSWLLGQMGQALIDLSKSFDDLATPPSPVETAAEPTSEGYEPWPETIGRQPGVDCPLEL